MKRVIRRDTRQKSTLDRIRTVLSMLVIAVVIFLVGVCLGGEIVIETGNTRVFLCVVGSLVSIFVFLVFAIICLRLIKPAVPPYTVVIRKEESEKEAEQE